ncbi:hypothetical protein BJV77DRAFT_980042, partial [Russula vinacea]
YIRDNVVSWFDWSRERGLPVERMEDLILVTGCTLVTSWAAAAFDNYTTSVDATSISLHARTFAHGGAQFYWSNIRGNIEYQNSHLNPVRSSESMRLHPGIPSKRRPFFGIKHIRAAAEPLPDDPDNRREDDIQVSRVPAVSNYRDPLKCIEDGTPEDTIAIVHDNDLELIEDVEILTADAVEKFLREKQMPLLVENGAAILDPHDNEPPVSDERKVTFYATAELNVRCHFFELETKY